MPSQYTKCFACLTDTGKLYGRQDDVVIAVQLAMIGCSKFFQDPKYRSFRHDDYTTPQGFTSNPQPPTNLD